MRRWCVLAGIVVTLSACGFPGNRDAGPNASAPAASAVRALSDTRPALLPDEVHSVHAPLGIPAGSPPSNDLIFRHSYTVSTNDETRFADWVAYAVIPEWLEDLSDPERDYRTDPFLDEDETLEERSGAGDYDGAHSAQGYDRGHLVPLGSFHGSPFAEEVNYLSVLAPQVDRLNRGAWRSLENRVRRLAGSIGPVYVLAGPAYDRSEPMPLLPGADEPHMVPAAYWMIVYSTGETGMERETLSSAAIRVCAFLVPQRLPAYDGPADFITTVDEIEVVTGLDMFSLLDDETQAAFETRVDAAWFETW